VSGRTALLLALWAFAPAAGLGILEMETWVSGSADGRDPAVLALVFPDTLGGTDMRVLLSPSKAGTTTFLPSGKLTSAEAAFVEGLRAFASGRADQASAAWAGLRHRRLDPLLRSCLNVNAGLVLCLRGEASEAEALWKREWKSRAPAAEGAWRNLLGLYLARRSFGPAQELLDRVLSEDPRSRTAALAKASLLRQTRPDAEVEAFLKEKSAARDSLPELQAAYGEFLAEKERWAEATPVLERALAALPRHGRGWRLLAESQYRRGYYFFALDCLENAFRAGYRESDLYELFARALRACCMAVEDERSVKARRTAERLLEEGLPKDLHRRSMAHLLYHVYCQNRKPEAARRLEQDLWFHFQGPEPSVPSLGFGVWRPEGLESLGLDIRIGLHSLTWMTALRHREFYRAF
jgi:tetratricopeptide (TPR) repeat protein